MPRLCCTAQFAAACAVTLALSGCGTVGIFGQYDLPESPEVADAPWPRLVDTPSAPPLGEYTDAVPDPAKGARTQTDLSASALVAEIRARELSAPVISDAEKARMLRRANRKQP
jgi:hypothetical protein